MVTLNIIDDEIFAAYVFYGGILAAKMLLMAPLTGRLRTSKGVFSSPEDVKLFKKGAVKTDDPDVQRVMNAHRNDMENIYLFFFVAALYMLTGPSKFAALNCFRAFTAARIAHTVAYVCGIPQPARGFSFGVGLVTLAFMIGNILMTFV